MKNVLMLGFAAVICLSTANVMGGYYDTQFDAADAVDDWEAVMGSWSLDLETGRYNAYCCNKNTSG